MKWLIDIPDGYDLKKVEPGSIAANKILQAVKAGKPLEDIPSCDTCYYTQNEIKKVIK